MLMIEYLECDTKYWWVVW